MSDLFTATPFTSHSGVALPWKIDCDALTSADWNCLAGMIAERVSFDIVWGIPEGGWPLATALRRYSRDDGRYTLLVDDVLTTGASMHHYRQDILPSVCPILGVVVFCRLPEPPEPWIEALFTMPDWRDA